MRRIYLNSESARPRETQKESILVVRSINWAPSHIAYNLSLNSAYEFISVSNIRLEWFNVFRCRCRQPEISEKSMSVHYPSAERALTHAPLAHIRHWNFGREFSFIKTVHMLGRSQPPSSSSPAAAAAASPLVNRYHFPYLTAIAAICASDESSHAHTNTDWLIEWDDLSALTSFEIYTPFFVRASASARWLPMSWINYNFALRIINTHETVVRTKKLSFACSLALNLSFNAQRTIDFVLDAFHSRNSLSHTQTQTPSSYLRDGYCCLHCSDSV